MIDVTAQVNSAVEIGRTSKIESLAKKEQLAATASAAQKTQPVNTGLEFDKMLTDLVAGKNSPLHGHELQKRKLADSCLEMESIFVNKMLKEMRTTVHKGEMFHGGMAEDFFEDMLYDEYAKNVSKNSRLGIARSMYQELSKSL